MAYQEINFQSNLKGSTHPSIIIVSVVEKLGVQAIKIIAPDLPPKPGKHKNVSRDYGYKRRGMVSFLAALDLHDGKISSQVPERHRSRELIELLKELDMYSPAKCTIRIILDNYSAHVSKETMGRQIFI